MNICTQTKNTITHEPMEETELNFTDIKYITSYNIYNKIILFKRKDRKLYELIYDK